MSIEFDGYSPNSVPELAGMLKVKFTLNTTASDDVIITLTLEDRSATGIYYQELISCAYRLLILHNI